MSDAQARLDVAPREGGFALAGEIDAHTAPALAAHLDPLPAGQGELVLDVAEVEFMDSSALRVLIEAHERAQAAGRHLILQSPTSAVLRLLEVSGVADHLTIR